jgi:plasmid stabilization system protein ParE
VTVIWRPKARRAFLAALEYLSDRDEAVFVKLNTVVELAVARLERTPQVARPSRYPGCRAWSLTKWSKVIVFRETPEGIEIVGFLDTRARPPERV